jgi:ABC-2 type transport system ATP-binding protein
VSAALRTQGLSKRFGDRDAFTDVTIEIAPGEVFGLLGPNGAGKTTLVRALATLLAPSAGWAEVLGLEVAPPNGVAIRSRIAVMTENPGLYRRLSVGENLEYFAGLYGVADVDAAVRRSLEAVDLADRRDTPCGGLSKGLAQRASLARALLSDPEVLFLDEPTSGLDPVAAREVYDLVEGLRGRGRTVLYTTHRLEEAEKLCDRVAILNTTLKVVGSPDELRARLFGERLTARLRAPLADADAALARVSGVRSWRLLEGATYEALVVDSDAAAPELARALVAAGADVLSLAPSGHSLEDVYLELVKGRP